MNARRVAYLGYLMVRSPFLLVVLARSLKDHAWEMHPEVLMADLARWAVAATYSGAPEADEALDELLAGLESSYGTDEDLAELISIGFLETLSWLDCSGTLGMRFGPRLATRWREIDKARPEPPGSRQKEG